MGWLLSPLANQILKTVINHTMNIQSKDFERMPYPWWVSNNDRAEVISLVKSMVEEARSGKIWSWGDNGIRLLGEFFEIGDEYPEIIPPKAAQIETLALF